MKTLIINGHPRKASFSEKLATAYSDGKKQAGQEVRLVHLIDLRFDTNLPQGYQTPLEPDLVKAQEWISEADHLVFVYPTWWWTMPALLKGFLDRVLIPGYAFQYEKGKPLPKKLLKGKTATLIVTMDGPSWYFRFWMRNVGHFAMKEGILAFCGIGPTKVVTLDTYNKRDETQKQKWLNKIKVLAMDN